MLRGFLCASVVAVLLAGCASVPVPRPQTHVAHHKAVAIDLAPVAAPVITPAPAKPTFKDRWHNFREKHPVTWLHH